MRKIPFREPFTFRLNYLWTVSRLFRFITLLVILLVTSLLFIFLVLPILKEIRLELPLGIDPGVAALLGVFIGGIITGLVSYLLQRDKFTGEALLEKRSMIYKPLYENLVDLLRELETKPFPWRISMCSGSNEPLRDPQPGFFEWSEISKDERYILVPEWLKISFEFFVDELDTYNKNIRRLAEEVGSILESDLKDRGLLESASGFGEFPLILAESYETKILTPFSVMKHGSRENAEKYEEVSVKLLPDLFRSYGQRDDVVSFRNFVIINIVGHATWLSSALERAIRLIEYRYGSGSRFI